MHMNKQGHAMVELALGMGALMILFHAVFVFCQLTVSRQRAFAAARLGTWLQTSGVITDETVNAEVESYMFLFPPIVKDAGWTTGRFMETPGSNFYWFLKTEIFYRVSHSFLRLVGLGNVVIRERVVAEKEATS